MDPDNLEASLDKVKLTERGYKLEKIKQNFLEALNFEHKELIAERPKNKTTPNVVHHQIQPSAPKLKENSLQRPGLNR